MYNPGDLEIVMKYNKIIKEGWNLKELLFDI